MVVIISSINADYSKWVHSNVGSSLHIPNAEVLFGKEKTENGDENKNENENENEVDTLFINHL